MAGKRGSACTGLTDLGGMSERGLLLSSQFEAQVNELHALGLKTDPEIEQEFYSNMLYNIQNPVEKTYVPNGSYIFMPSSASKCKRDLFIHITGGKKYADGDRVPYHTRWTRNSNACHDAVQKDFLYMEKYLPDAPFKIHKVDGLPMWEENLKTTTLVEHAGKQFALVGQMDGILEYTPENRLIGFEYKTKSNSVAQVGTYKMKDVGEAHKLQAVCYRIMFGLNEFIFMYEAVAKDQWNKGWEARPDIRVFHILVTDEMVREMQDKFVEVIQAAETKTAPAKELDKCLLCDYKNLCAEIGG